MNIIVINSTERFLGEAEVSKEKVEVKGIEILGAKPSKADVESYVEKDNVGELSSVTFQGAVNYSIQPISKVLERHLSVAKTVMAEVKKSHMAEHQNYKFKKAMKGNGDE